MAMKRKATRLPKGSWPCPGAGAGVEEAGEVEPHLQPDQLARKTPAPRRRCARQSPWSGRSAPAGRSAGSAWAASPAARPGWAGSEACRDRDEERQPDAARIGTDALAEGRHARNSASDADEGQSSGFIRASNWASVKPITPRRSGWPAGCAGCSPPARSSSTARPRPAPGWQPPPWGRRTAWPR